MKLIAAILSVYVIALTAMPCFDVHAAETNSVSIVISEQNNNKINDIDLCSPFCYCNCCQTLSQPVIYNAFQANLVCHELTITLLVQNDSKCAISFWRPPKI